MLSSCLWAAWFLGPRLLLPATWDPRIRATKFVQRSLSTPSQRIDSTIALQLPLGNAKALHPQAHLVQKGVGGLLGVVLAVGGVGVADALAALAEEGPLAGGEGGAGDRRDADTKQQLEVGGEGARLEAAGVAHQEAVVDWQAGSIDQQLLGPINSVADCAFSCIKDNGILGVAEGIWLVLPVGNRHHVRKGLGLLPHRHLRREPLVPSIDRAIRKDNHQLPAVLIVDEAEPPGAIERIRVDPKRRIDGPVQRGVGEGQAGTGGDLPAGRHGPLRHRGHHQAGRAVGREAVVGDDPEDVLLVVLVVAGRVAQQERIGVGKVDEIQDCRDHRATCVARRAVISAYKDE